MITDTADWTDEERTCLRVHGTLPPRIAAVYESLRPARHSLDVAADRYADDWHFTPAEDEEASQRIA